MDDSRVTPFMETPYSSPTTHQKNRENLEIWKSEVIIIELPFWKHFSIFLRLNYYHRNIMGMYFSRRTGWRLAAVVPKPGGNRTGWAGWGNPQGPAMEVFFGGKIIKLWGDGFPASHEADHQRLHKVCCFIPIFISFSLGPSETSFIPKLLLRVFCKTEIKTWQNRI